ncbi:MAG: tetratricopeptide repeat protein [Treponema sp.]|nr:tetratricopeptide repeat protein [Treponema sp.]
MLYINSDPLLNKAALLAKKRDFELAFKILQNEEDRYNGSFKYYQLFGIISLHSGNFVEANEYFQLAWRQKPKDKLTMLGLAVRHLKHLNTAQAVDYYLDVLEMDPKNKIAKLALDVIRKHSSAETLSDWISSPQRLAKLFPPIPYTILTKKTFFNAALIAAIVIVLTFASLIMVKVLPSPFKSRTERPTSDYILSTQERRDSITAEMGGYYRYILTREQAINLYDRSIALFTAYRDEAAKINLNRILESNASDNLKSRARLLMNNMEVPGFDTFKRADNPSFSDIKNEPFVYRDVHVIWRGMATNVELTDEFTRFDLLIGYDTRRTLEGIILVEFDRPVAINTERPLEVLGRVNLSSSHSDIILQGVSIHQSGRLEN